MVVKATINFYSLRPSTTYQITTSQKRKSIIFQPGVLITKNSIVLLDNAKDDE